MSGDNLVLPITGTYNVRVQCFERQDPDSFTCPTTTTTTTQRTTTEVQQQTTEVQQQTTTTQDTSGNNKGTGSGSNGENTESESCDRTNLCTYSVQNLLVSIRGISY